MLSDKIENTIAPFDRLLWPAETMWWDACQLLFINGLEIGLSASSTRFVSTTNAWIPCLKICARKSSPLYS